ncbi:MAG: beta-ketoacyl-ACP synthase III [Brevinema sp.]
MPIGFKEIGVYTPANIVTNDDLSKTLDTSDEWISSRTGIKERRIATQDETTASMAWEAVQDLMKKSGDSLQDIDLIVCATVTSEERFPSVAARVQAKLGVPDIPTFDSPVGCGGFLYVLSMAQAYVKSGAAKKVLCLVSEKLSSIMDWTDRNTCVLFGDAAAAVVIQDSPDSHELLQCTIGGDGAYGDLLRCPVGGTTTMDGAGVFKVAVRIMDREVRRSAQLAGIEVSDIDYLIPHQANLRIISSVGDKLGVSSEKTIVNLDKYANTSCVSIPLAMSEAVSDDRFQKGNVLSLVAIGAGFAWGSALVRW